MELPSPTVANGPSPHTFPLESTVAHPQIGGDDSDASVDHGEDDGLSLVRTASAISGHHAEYRRRSHSRSRAELTGSSLRQSLSLGPLPGPAPILARPDPVKPGPFDVIHELPSEAGTPAAHTHDVSPLATPPIREQIFQGFDVEENVTHDYPDIGTIRSWRGCFVLVVTCGAQLLDNVFMTGVNISLPAIQREFGINSSQLQWLISAYTLTFGGFLLLAGVMSDRYGRKNVFCVGMLWLSVWTFADGFASSFPQLAVFRALSGMGAAMTVPSGIGIISSFFIAQDRTKALTYFGASGAVGFVVGLLAGGFLTASLSWRYLFYLTVILTSVLAVLGFFILPKDRRDADHARPRLDILGAGLSTSGLVLLSFVLSSGGEYGWNKAFIIVLLVIAIAMLALFTWVEKKVPNPIMPMSLWKLPNFAGVWITGFLVYGNYQSLVYYATLISQEVIHLSAGDTALRLVPMGFVGGCVAVGMGSVMEKFNVKHLLVVGLVLCTIAPIPSAIMPAQDLSFWKHVFPSSILSVMGIAITYCTITVVLLESVPLSAKSLCGGMINTAFQIGSGVGLALCTAVVDAADVQKGHSTLLQYRTGMWCCVGLAGAGVISSAFGVKSVKHVGATTPLH